MKKFRILVTGGGTGGHIYPIIAVVSELQIASSRIGINTEIRYLGSSQEYKALLESNEIKVTDILSSKIRRYFSISNLFDLFKLKISIIQSLWCIFWFMPDVVFSKGGPGALAVVLASRFYGIPILIHESDAAPGMTNLISGKFAKTIAVAFNSAIKFFPNKEVVLVGNPIRKYLLSEDINQYRAKGFLEFDQNLPLLLVLGGSQGSTRINNFILDNLPKLLEFIQVLHQTGKDNYRKVIGESSYMLKVLSPEIQKKYKAVDYFEKDIRIAMIASDVVLSRSGAGSIFEIAAFGKPSILVPLPESAQNHQVLNAYDYSASGAGIVIEETNLLPNLFIQELKQLLSVPDKLNSMSVAAKQFAKLDAASNLAQIIIRLGGYVPTSKG